MAPPHPTCNDNTYDYFVVSRSLAHAVLGASRILDVDPSPHYPTRLFLRARPRAVLVRQLRRPLPFEAALPFGPPPAPHRTLVQAEAIALPRCLTLTIMLTMVAGWLRPSVSSRRSRGTTPRRRRGMLAGPTDRPSCGAPPAAPRAATPACSATRPAPGPSRRGGCGRPPCCSTARPIGSCLSPVSGTSIMSGARSSLRRMSHGGPSSSAGAGASPARPLARFLSCLRLPRQPDTMLMT